MPLSPKGPRLELTSVTFKNGQTITLSSDDVVLVVGPNNVGKSALLRELDAKISDKVTPGQVLRDVTFNLSGNYSEVEEWVLARGRVRGDMLFFSQTNFQVGHLKSFWDSASRGARLFRGALYLLLNTEERLSAANSAQLHNFTEQPPNHPLHQIYLSENVEAEVSRVFFRAFGEDLIMNRLAGSQAVLHVGARPVRNSGESTTSDAYVRVVERLPPLQSQGDGMRCFAGIIVSVMTGDQDVLIIDEPEAFLHPPQARLLGHLLVKDKRNKRQLIVATHSGDFLRGAINASTVSTTRLRVLRLTRQGNINSIHELDHSGIGNLWKDPLLRQSNALDGLFHEQTIICEADGDCRFFAAVMDALWTTKEDALVPDVMFTHCGGKDRIHVLASALRALNVRVKVVADFDVLREEATMKRIVEALNGNWSELETDWRTVANAIRSKKAELQRDELKKGLDDVLSSITTPAVPDDAREQIRKLTAQSSPWAIAKQTGKAYVPNGEPTAAFERLSAKLRECGLHVIETGELESFDKSCSGHGPAWVNQVLAKDLANDPGLREAREFVERLLI